MPRFLPIYAGEPAGGTPPDEPETVMAARFPGVETGQVLAPERSETPIEDSLARVQRVLIPAFTTIRHEVSGVRFFFVSAAASLNVGWADGDLELALGKMGEFFRFGSGLTLRFKRVNVLRLRNTIGTNRTIEIVTSVDPGLLIYYSPSPGIL